jgi:hypothetical protein
MSVVTRRRFLLAIASGAAALGAAVLVGQVGGYSLDDETRRKLRALTPGKYVVLAAAARRILAADGTAPTADQIGVAGYIDGWLHEAPTLVRRDFGRLLGVVEHGTPLWSGRRRRFTDLSAADQDAHLERLSHSSIGALREGMAALKSLCMLGYYRDPRTWAICGYEGPTVPPGWAGGEEAP